MLKRVREWYDCPPSDKTFGHQDAGPVPSHLRGKDQAETGSVRRLYEGRSGGRGGRRFLCLGTSINTINGSVLQCSAHPSRDQLFPKPKKPKAITEKSDCFTRNLQGCAAMDTSMSASRSTLFRAREGGEPASAESALAESGGKRWGDRCARESNDLGSSIGPRVAFGAQSGKNMHGSSQGLMPRSWVSMRESHLTIGNDLSLFQHSI